MKIYNEIVFDVDGNVTYEDSFEYSGDVMLCQPKVPDMNKDGFINIQDYILYNQQQYAEKPETTEESLTADIQETVGGVLEGTYGGAQAAEMAQTQALAAQTQASDIQLNALPSLPSISTVGAIAPTGTINWNAVPGGFQPLPQTVGGRKKLYQLSQFHGGVNQKSSSRDIADFECQEAENVTFSEVGRIKLLGDCLNENNTLKEFGTVDTANLPGYGLFEFISPPHNQILVTADEDRVDILDSDSDSEGWIDMNGTDDGTVAQIYYASGNGLYVADASFQNARRAKIYVYRNDINATVAVSGWREGNPLIGSPTRNSSATNSHVTLQTSHVDAAGTGRMNVTIIDTGTGTWGVGASTTYYFYASYLFDGGCETGLTSLGTDAFEDETCQFNVSITHTAAAPLGGDKRIEGARIYFKKAGTSERWLLAEISLIDGVKGALDSTFTPWNNSTGTTYDMGSGATEANITFVNPPEVYSYASLNGYYANEVYTKSPDAAANGAGPTPIPLKYKTVVVGQSGIVFIGNVSFDGKHMPDSMMYSMPNKPGLFPKYNIFDSPSSDGSQITALAAFQNTILQFKQNAMYVINVSDPAQFYAEKSFRGCGVWNPCQVFTTSFGVIFVNNNGCFIYDGQKVISLTDGKFDWVRDSGVNSSGPSDTTGADVPCVGYDPRSQSIIVLKDIGDDSVIDDGWIYNMTTQSWTEGIDIISNANNRRHTNFIITQDNYLSIKRDNEVNLLNYNHDKRVDTGGQTITYWTKDLDFGTPSQSKYLYKVYVTWKGNGANLYIKYGVEGETDSNDLYSFSTATPLDDQSSDENRESWHTAALFPATASEGKGWRSISIYMNGAVDSTFEINSIAILYRVRPIK